MHDSTVKSPIPFKKFGLFIYFCQTPHGCYYVVSIAQILDYYRIFP